MRVYLVFNRFSDQAPWFRNATARRNGREDWRILADPRADGAPTNDWLSFFGQPGWRWVPAWRQYVLEPFLRSHPCLELRQPPMQAALADIVCCWRDRGADSFRLNGVYTVDLRNHSMTAARVATLDGAPIALALLTHDHVRRLTRGGARRRCIRAWCKSCRRPMAFCA